MRIPDAGLPRTEELDSQNAETVPAIVIWAAAVGIIVWVLAAWKFLEIIRLLP